MTSFGLLMLGGIEADLRLNIHVAACFQIYNTSALSHRSKLEFSRVSKIYPNNRYPVIQYRNVLPQQRSAYFFEEKRALMEFRPLDKADW